MVGKNATCLSHFGKQLAVSYEARHTATSGSGRLPVVVYLRGVTMVFTPRLECSQLPKPGNNPNVSKLVGKLVVGYIHLVNEILFSEKELLL